ncbi:MULTISPECIES: BsuPI-related putative proteinase inhibitor [unclassified Shewanella]|uniref:BsuPI-related putative proteinase inhibitor n=1 Tax=unclassified Shewanella TaxID=196818 RepID=UPI001BBA33B9|nr:MULTISPECIES: BsuPI-related putative proteinase inhibitor [unclassified Shewanella]GIU16011.1 proteinase inhibitor [Shewanella sp. MBTL60-112-B1]GIU33912.1 proteinase inhibitor [Shewanella sp. MBTL60-112-B2]
MAKTLLLPLIAISLLGCSGQQTEGNNLNKSAAPSAPSAQLEPSPAASNPTIVGGANGEQRYVKEGKAVSQGLLDAQLIVKNKADITLEYTNNQSYGVPLMFSSGMTADLWLLDPQGKRVWAWSNEMMFTQAIRELVMPAGKTQRVEFKIPADIAVNIGEGYSLKATFGGRATESQVPAMLPVIYSY